MERPAKRHEMILELTEEQRRRIKSMTGKDVTELQIEIVEEAAKLPVTAARNYDESSNESRP